MELFLDQLVEYGCSYLPIDLVALSNTHMHPLHSFFTSPLSEKLQTISKDRARRGYAPASTENFASLVGERGKPNDLVEKFRIGPEILLETKDQNTSYFSCKEAKVHFFPNDWSGTDVAFRDLALRIYQCLEEVAKAIIAEAISQQYDGARQLLWDSYFQLHTSILSINHYSSTAVTTDSEIRIAEHTDVSFFTIVINLDKGCDNVCLQVYHRDTDSWHDVVFEPNTAIVLVGEYLEFVSNGRFPAARHRVVNKISDETLGEKIKGEGRLSCAFFVTPNYDAVINLAPLSSATAAIVKVAVGDKDEEKTELASEELSSTTYDVWRKRKIAQVVQQQKQAR